MPLQPLPPVALLSVATAVPPTILTQGGAKVVAALEASLQLAEGALDHERAVLRDYGNMSAPTVLFVLKRLLEAGKGGGRTMLLAPGPGFTTSGSSLPCP